MKEEDIIDLLPDYLDGNLDPATVAEVEKHLKENNIVQKALDDYKKLFEAFKAEPVYKPSSKLGEGFAKLLAEEKSNQIKVLPLHATPKTRRKYRLPRIAASILLLLGAYFMGRFSQEKVSERQLVAVQEQADHFKEVAMISMLENESASKRIQGVQLIQDLEKPDMQIVNALGEKVLHDSNTNVRLTALEALSSFSYSEQVKTIFIEALEQEKNPSVQMALIDVLVKLQEKKAITPMKKLLEEEETQPFIKDQINSAIHKII